jgi:hypothetical protein
MRRRPHSRAERAPICSRAGGQRFPEVQPQGSGRAEACAARRPGTRQATRLAGMTAAGFGITSAVASLAELGLGAWLVGTLVPQRRTVTVGTAYHALMRLDGAKMFLLAIMAIALSVVAISAAILPRWLAPIGFLLGASLVVSGLGYVLLAPGLANSVWVSGILLLAFVPATGVTLGAARSDA